jgi:hypothetical protein
MPNSGAATWIAGRYTRMYSGVMVASRHKRIAGTCNPKRTRSGTALLERMTQ